MQPPEARDALSDTEKATAASGAEGLSMRYVGRIPLAKSHGTLGLYNVRPVA